MAPSLPTTASSDGWDGKQYHASLILRVESTLGKELKTGVLASCLEHRLGGCSMRGQETSDLDIWKLVIVTRDHLA